MSGFILNPEFEHAQFVSIAELKECERKLDVLNRGNANAERILCELTGCESGRDIPEWITNKNFELLDLQKAYLELVHKHALAENHINQLKDIINRASNRFFTEGPDGKIAAEMLVILEERHEAKP